MKTIPLITTSYANSDTVATASTLVERDSSGDLFAHVLSGGLKIPVVTKTATYVATADDALIAVNPASDTTITLPAAATVLGRMFIVKHVPTVTSATNAWVVTLAGNGAELIDGVNTKVLAWGQCVALISDATGWHTFPALRPRARVRSVSGTSDTATVDDEIILFTHTTDAVTAYLPSAITCPGLVLTFKQNGTGVVTVTKALSPGTDTIDGSSSGLAVVARYGVVKVVSDGVSNWNVLRGGTATL
jgi:hypothetical protein